MNDIEQAINDANKRLRDAGIEKETCEFYAIEQALRRIGVRMTLEVFPDLSSEKKHIIDKEISAYSIVRPRMREGHKTTT